MKKKVDSTHEKFMKHKALYRIQRTSIIITAQEHDPISVRKLAAGASPRIVQGENIIHSMR